MWPEVNSIYEETVGNQCLACEGHSASEPALFNLWRLLSWGTEGRQYFVLVHTRCIVFTSAVGSPVAFQLLFFNGDCGKKCFLDTRRLQSIHFVWHSRSQASTLLLTAELGPGCPSCVNVRQVEETGRSPHSLQYAGSHTLRQKSSKRLARVLECLKFVPITIQV